MTFRLFASCLIRTLQLFALLLVGTTLGSGVAHAQFRAYVANSGSHTVTAIDTASRAVLETIPVGDNPSGIAITPDGGLAYVANSGSGTVSVIDTTVNEVVATIEVGVSPQDIVITPDGALLYVTHPDLHALSVIETAGNTVAATIPIAGSPRAIAMAPDGALAYVGYVSQAPYGDFVSAIAVATQTVTATVAFPRWFLPGLQSVAISPDGAFVYVTTYLFQSVYIVDTSSHAIVGFLGREVGGSGSVGYRGTSAVTLDGASLFVPNYYRPAVEIFNAASGGLPHIIPTTSRPEMVAMTPDGAFAYVTGSPDGPSTGGDVTVIDIVARTVVGQIPVGSTPQAIAISPRVSAIPGRIEAEDYDAGGPGVGYVDTTPGNEQGVPVYRAGDVDVKVSSEGGHAIGWFAAGEWLAYTAHVQSDGLYTIQARVGSALPGRTFHIEVDGVDATGEIAVPQVAAWDQYETVSIADVSLSGGTRVVRVVLGTEDFVELQWIGFVQQEAATAGPFAGVPQPIPGRIQAEDYDRGGSGLSYFDTSPGNEQGAPVYRAGDVDIKMSSEGGHSVGWLVSGEWLAYTTSLQSGGIYTIEARVGSPLPGRTFHIEADGVDVTGPIVVPQVADWDRYETVSVPGVLLTAGTQVLRVVMGPEDYMDFQWFAIER